VRSGVKVERLSRRGDHWLVEGDGLCLEADNVVIASGAYQDPHVPEFAHGLDPGIVQIHSSRYRNPSQLQPGPVLVVGAGNSGADIALDVAGGHRTWMAGRDVGHLPFGVSSLPARLLLARIALRVVFHRVLTLDTPIGRKARPALTSRGGPLIRIREADLAAAGVERAPRMVGTERGLPRLEDGRVLEVADVIWCTGFRNGLAWAGLPEHGVEAASLGRVVADRPGLYLVGQQFLHAMSSAMIHGVERDAAFVADAIAARAGAIAARAGAKRPEVTKFAGDPVAGDGRWAERPHGEPACQGDGAWDDPADRRRSAFSPPSGSPSRS
jgi:putative flavoprotein involved in K+ transport